MGLTASGLGRRALHRRRRPAPQDNNRAVGDRPHVRQQARPRSAAAGQERPDGPTTEQVLRIEQLEAQIRQLTGTSSSCSIAISSSRTGSRRGRHAGGPRRRRPGRGRAAAPLRRRRAAAAAGRALAGAGRAVAAGLAAAGTAAAPTCSTRRRTRTRPARRARSAACQQRAAARSSRAEPPVGAPGGRGAGAPLDLSTLSSGPGAEPGDAARRAGLLPAPPSRNPSATGAVASVAPPSETPKDEYDLAYGYVLRKDYALAEEAFQEFLKKYPTDRRARRRAVLAGREPVPAPELSTPRRRPSSTCRPRFAATPRRRRRCCGSASRSPR